MNQQKLYYFDNNATTRVAPEVMDVMIPYLRDYWGNPSSAYSFGHQLANHLEDARQKVAALINADPREVVFTSCGTESNNSVIHSALAANPGKRHLITTGVEHSSIINFCEYLQKLAYEVTFLPVESDGELDIHLLEKSIRPDTALVSVMWANNETGVIFPIDEIAALCRGKGVLFHTDAVQVAASEVDFLSLSAHKLHAPKGIGAIYVKRRTNFQPYVIGGQQERGRRGGTENVANIIAFGKAAELAMERIGEEKRIGRLRDFLEESLLRTIPNAFRNGAKEPRLVNTTNIAFDFVEAEAVLMLLDQVGICASSGSACTTGSIDPSHVLTAMGVSPMRARGSLRFSLGIYTTDAEVDYLLSHLPGIINKLRLASPLLQDPQNPAARSEVLDQMKVAADVNPWSEK